MNKGVYVVQNGKLKKVIASGYGDGLVKTVNGIEPDQRGDVDLGEIASPTDVEVAKDNAIKTARDLAKVDMEMATEGIRGFMHRGVWASGVEYEKNNLVIYNESVYQAIKDIKDSDKEVEVEEPETEAEDNEDVVEEVEDTEEPTEPTEPTEEHNPVEINPEDEEFGFMYWRMFAPKTSERPRGTYAEAVNGIVPDKTGNVDLGQIASIDDVEYGMNEAIKGSNNYTDEQIEKIKEEGIGGGDVSTEDLNKAIGEAKDHANQVAGDARVEANQYTDGEIKKVKEDTKVIVSDVLKDYPQLHLATRPPTESDNWMGLWGVYTAGEDPNVKTLSELEFGETIDTGILVPPELNIDLTEPTILAKKIGEDTYGMKEVTLLTDFLPLNPIDTLGGIFSAAYSDRWSSASRSQSLEKLLPNTFWLTSESLDWFQDWKTFILGLDAANQKEMNGKSILASSEVDFERIADILQKTYGNHGFGSWFSPSFKDNLLTVSEYDDEGKMIKKSWGIVNSYRLNKNYIGDGTAYKRAFQGTEKVNSWDELFSTERLKDSNTYYGRHGNGIVAESLDRSAYEMMSKMLLPFKKVEGGDTPMELQNYPTVTESKARMHELPFEKPTSSRVRLLYTAFHMKPTTLVRKQDNGRWEILDSSIQEVEITRLFARKQK